MKKFTFLLSLLCTMFISSAMAQVNQTVVFDFEVNEAGIPDQASTNFSGVKSATEYTFDGQKIQIDPTANGGNFYYDNCLILGKTGSKIVLPAFSFPVEKIELVGNSKGSSYVNVDMNVYVGATAVSTATIGTTATYTYQIAADYQAAGNVYEMVIGNNGGNYSSIMFISAIKVYPKNEEGTLTVKAPAFDKESGIYTEPIEVIAHSESADFAGVEDIVYYYTTDGNNPTTEDEESTDGKIAIGESCTLKVVVSFKYEGSTYTSEASEAEYIISEVVTCEKATSFTYGRYFIAANGKIATIVEDNVLPTGDAEETTETSITGVGYYAYVFETISTPNSGEGVYEEKLYIKDPEGKYLRIDAGGATLRPKLTTMATYHQCDVEVVIEDGVAKITKNGYYIVYDSANNAFTITDTPEGATFPTLYLIEKFDQSESVEDIEIENGEQAIYDLSGRCIETITEAGIYIVNGKKVLKK